MYYGHNCIQVKKESEDTSQEVPAFYQSSWPDRYQRRPKSFELSTMTAENTSSTSSGQFGDNHKVKLGRNTLENQRCQAGQDAFWFVGALGAIYWQLGSCWGRHPWSGPGTFRFSGIWASQKLNPPALLCGQFRCGRARATFSPFGNFKQ